MAVLENDLVVGPLVPAVGVTTISLDYYFEQASWLEVYKTGSETPLILNTDYTVTGAGTGSGVVTLTTAANGTDAYSIYLVVPLQRSSDMQLRGEFKSEPFNIEMDRLWQRLQYHWTHIQRSLRLSMTTAMDTVLSAVSPGQLVQMKGDGTGFVGFDPNITVTQVDAWYHTRNAAQAALAAALPDGSTVSIAGLLYLVDGTATGSTSAANDLGVNGLRPFGQAAPEHYGAVGDGSTDDTTAIQAALTQNLSVLFGEKTYRVTDTLLYRSNQRVFGKSRKACIQFPPGAIKTMFKPAGPFGTVSVPNSYSVDFVTFEDICLDANHVDVADFNSAQMIIAAISAKHMRIRNVHFKNPMADAVYVGSKFISEKSTVMPYDIQIEGCLFSGDNINRNGVSVITGANIGIRGCHFYKITKPDMPGPIDLEPNSLSETITNVQIVGNSFDQCKNGIASYIVGAGPNDLTTIQNISIIGNNFYSQVVLSPYVAEVQAYIAMFNASNVTVQGNNLHNASDMGMAFTYAARLNVTGNNVYNPALMGIRIEDIQNSKIDSNFFSLQNDQYNGVTCVGIDVDTKGAGATNYAFVNGSMMNNTFVCTAASPTNNYAIVLQGNVTGVDISGVAKGFARGIYQGTRAGVSPTLNRFNFDVSQCITPYVSSFSIGTPKSLGHFNLGENVTYGKSAFSASTSKVLTGLPVRTTSIVRVTRIGTTGLANTLTASVPTDGQITVTSSASESGEFVWEILQF